MFLGFVATLCAGVFFGAALYTSIVQHPASLEAGGPVLAPLFPPMYRRAAPVQAALALIGSAAALLVWLRGVGWGWVVGGLLLAAVVPFTFLRIKPVNDQLLQAGHDPEAPETLALLEQWGRLHLVRSMLSGFAFVLFLSELAFP